MSLGEDVGVCACKILFLRHPRVIDKAGHLLYGDGLNAGRGFEEEDRGQYDAVEEVPLADGAASLYRKAMLDEIGLFDEQFFMYGEDAELGLRARLYGWRCIYRPSAVVYHVHSGTIGQFMPLKAMYVERNRFWLAVKLFPLPVLLATPFLTLIRFFWHAYGAMTGKGSAGSFVAKHSRMALLRTLVKAYASAVRGLPRIIRKRLEIRRKKTMTDWEFIKFMWRFRVSARELALRNR